MIQDLIKSMGEKEEMYVDKEFPANNESLCKDQTIFSSNGYDKITWKRAGDIKPICIDKPNPESIFS